MSECGAAILACQTLQTSSTVWLNQLPLWVLSYLCVQASNLPGARILNTYTIIIISVL